MSSNSSGGRGDAGAVKDRSGVGLPPKAERRALGKAAAAKRAAQRRRKQILSRVGQIAAPFVVVGLIIGAIYLFGGGGDDEPTTNEAAGPTATQPTAEAWSLPTGMDPQLATRPQVTAGEGTLSELKVTTIVAGTGTPLVAGDTITVNYVGVYYATGEEFDSSWDPTPSPVEFGIGVGAVIAGWDQGLVGVPVGSRVQLDIPVALAYNHQPGRPDGDLRFIVDVLGTTTT